MHLSFVFVIISVFVPLVSADYIGCFSDHTQIIESNFNKHGTASPRDTFAECHFICATRFETTYFAVKNGQECYCGDSFHVIKELRSDDCLTCATRPDKECGAPGVASVYTVCPRGEFQQNHTEVLSGRRLCRAKCNCKDGVICRYKTGECPDGCAVGWMGIACNERGIQTSNLSTTTISKASSLSTYSADVSTTATIDPKVVTSTTNSPKTSARAESDPNTSTPDTKLPTTGTPSTDSSINSSPGTTPCDSRGSCRDECPPGRTGHSCGHRDTAEHPHEHLKITVSATVAATLASTFIVVVVIAVAIIIFLRRKNEESSVEDLHTMSEMKSGI